MCANRAPKSYWSKNYFVVMCEASERTELMHPFGFRVLKKMTAIMVVHNSMFSFPENNKSQYNHILDNIISLTFHWKQIELP